MSNLSTADRAKLPLSAFGWPAQRKFPIMDASDVAAAATLLGRAPPSQQAAIKRRIMAICKSKNLPIPKAWQMPMHGSS